MTCRESWVRGSSLRDRLPTRHTIDVDAAKLDYPSEISSMMLHHAAAEPNIQKRPDGGIGVPNRHRHHFGRPKDFVAAAITALIGLKYDMVRLREVMAHADAFVIERVEWLAEA